MTRSLVSIWVCANAAQMVSQPLHNFASFILFMDAWWSLKNTGIIIMIPCWESSFPTDCRIQDKVLRMTHRALHEWSGPHLSSSFCLPPVCPTSSSACHVKWHAVPWRYSKFPTSKLLPTHYPPPLPCAHQVGLEMLDQRLLIQIPRKDRQIM